MRRSPRPSYRRPRRLLTLLTLVTLLPVAGLVWLGSALLAQDRDLAEKQLRDRLEREADSVVAMIARDVTPPSRSASDPPARTAVPPASTWERAEAAEHRGLHDAAIDAYRRLARSPDPAVQGGAMIRLARTLRRADRSDEALRIYDEMKSMDDVRVFDAPASLWAALARITELDNHGRRDLRDREAAAVRGDLARGRWKIDQPMFENAWMQVASPVVLGEGWRTLARERRLAMTLSSADGKPVVERGQLAAPIVVRTPNESRLPWTLRLSSASPEAELAAYAGRRRQLLLVLSLAVFVALAGAYFVARGFRRELAVAELQSTFVSAVSHEFRTPLTSMSHLIELLRDRPDIPPARRSRYYDALEQEALRLRRFVDQLLDFGRLEAGEATYQITATDPTILVGNVVTRFRNSPAASHHLVEVSMSPQLPAIDADAEAMLVALHNLLENAAKYSPQAQSIRIDARHDSAGNCVLIDVRDQGPGIPRDEQKVIFDKFVRGRGARASGVRGTGVGLTLSRQIVRAHGGDIAVVSEPGRGSTFTISMPVTESGETPHRVTS